MGEIHQFEIGRNIKDPAILPRVISYLTLSYATIGYCKTDFIVLSYDFNFEKGYFKTNCLLKHSCMKCGGMHPSAMCNKCKQTNNIKTSYKASPCNLFFLYLIVILDLCNLSENQM
jgi:hypothetical protein